jgi:hypothetical protein
MAVVIAQAPAAASLSVTATGTYAFNVIAGEPGAGAQLYLNAPGSNRLNGQRFRIRAAGGIQLNSGSYTATVQPVLFASKTPGFTAGAGNTIFAPTAGSIAITVTQKLLWSFDVDLNGDNNSGTLQGSGSMQFNNAALAVAQLGNLPTALDFSVEPPLQFSVGIVLGTSVGTFSSGVLTLSQFQLEAS